MENKAIHNEYRSPYNNPYVLRQYEKKDLIFTKKKTKQYNRIKKLENHKLFTTKQFGKIKNPIFSSLEKYKKKVRYEFCELCFSHEFERSIYLEKDNLKSDIEFKYLYVYDILPKEDIYKFREGLIEYSEICQHLLSVADEFTIKNCFDDMANHNYKYSAHNLRYFVISDKMLSYKWIEDVYIIIEEYGESFYFITYRLKLKENVTNELKTIMNSLVLYEPLFHRKSNNKPLSASENHMPALNRQKALNDLILEIKFNFIHEINKYVPCFLHRHNITPPSLGVYIFDNIDKLLIESEGVLSLLDFYTNCYDISKDHNIIVNLKYRNKPNTPSCVVNRNFIKDTYALSTLDNYFSPFAEYLIFQTLNPIIEKLIIENQQKLNKLMRHNFSASKLLKEKIKTLKSLNIYKRLIATNQKQLENPYNNWYNNSFENIFNDTNYYKDFSNAFSLQLYITKQKCEDFQSQIESLYKFYDEDLEAVESSTNIRLVRLTLIITAITLLATFFSILISLKIIP